MNCLLFQRFRTLWYSFIYFYKNAIFFALLIIPYTTFSQKPYTPVTVDPLTEPWRWRHFPELMGKGLRCLNETADGNMWFGTDRGVIRYDGINWIFYNKTNGFIDSPVNNICVTKDQKIYAGTDKGLFLFTGKEWKCIFPHIKDSAAIQVQKVKCLLALKDGTILASVGNFSFTGLVSIRGQKQTFISSALIVQRLKGKLNNMQYSTVLSEHAPDDKFEVEEIFQDKENKIWMATRRRSAPLYLFTCNILGNNPDTLIISRFYSEKDGLRHGKFTNFLQSFDSNIWMINGDYDKGVSIFNGQFWSSFKLSKYFGGDELHTAVLQTHDGTMWIGGMGSLYAYRDGQWRSYKKPEQSIPLSKINLFEDSKGFLWILGKHNEILQVDYSGYNWTTYKDLNYQCETSGGRKWYLSVEGKVVVNDRGNWHYYGVDDGVPDAPVRIFRASNDVVWVAGSNNFIAATAWFDGVRWNLEQHPALSWGIDYRAVFEDKDKNLWFGCSVDVNEAKGQLAGVMKLEGFGTKHQKWFHYTPQGTFKMFNSYGIGQSKDGAIWMGGTRLVRFEGEKWERTDSNFVINTYYDYVTSTQGGMLWVGSRYYGIFGYDGKKWITQNVSTGLPSNTIIHILPINDRHLVVATDNNLCLFDGETWIKDAFPEKLIFTREGGDLKLGADGTIWINKSLREWKRRSLNNNILTQNIIDNFYTIGYKPDSVAPDTHITDYSKEVSRLGNTVISWSGTDYFHRTPSSRLAFSYRLNGGDWSLFSEKAYETFVGLKSGNYSIEVRARDLDLNVDKTPAIAIFKVLPIIWEQTWFVVLLAVFAIIIGIYEYFALRQNKKLLRLYHSLSKAKETLEEQKEQILEQIKTDKESYQLKIRFFTRVSHEFRTPLTLISGASEKLKVAVNEHNKAAISRNVQILSRNSNQLLKLINQLMDFRKLETESIDLHAIKGNISKFIEGICNNFRNVAQQYSINLEYYTNINNPETWFDADKVEKIMYNLLANAIKFTPEGGIIRVSIQTIELIGQVPKMFSITVEDTGIGIPEDEIEKIFEPFYQGKTPPVRKYEGTGIGLSLVKNLVELHYGKLYVESCKNDFKPINKRFTTTFIIQLPFGKDYLLPEELEDDFYKPVDDSEDSTSMSLEIENSDDLKEDAEPVSDENLIKLPTVLLVEDNEDMWCLITDSYSSHYRIFWAKNGEEGYNFAVEHIPDLIISDVMMPVMNGIDMCRKLKNDARTSYIPVIMLTARATDDHHIEGLEAGADDYITKPFNIVLLGARLKNIIESRDMLRKKFRRELELQPLGKIIPVKEEDFIKKIIDIIESNLSNNAFDVEHLSREVGLSSRHLLNKMQNLTDYTPVEFIRTYRLKRAEQLLLQRNLTISEVAYDVGFSDPNYFSKCFQKQYGKTPKDFVAAIKTEL